MQPACHCSLPVFHYNWTYNFLYGIQTMSQVTIYLDSELENRVKAAAKARGISVSRCIAEFIREKTDNGWPQEIREMAGSWGSFPSAEEIRAGQGSNATREPL